jgi:hypothetical protein
MPDTSRKSSALAIIALTALALGACTATGSGKSTGGGTTTTPAAPTYQPATDIPIPPGTKINTEKSLILGAPDKWLGRIVLSVGRPTTQTYQYYVDEMPAFGWEQVTAVQGKTSTMTYVRGERAALVEIGPGALSGSEVSVTVSLRQQPGGAAK